MSRTQTPVSDRIIEECAARRGLTAEDLTSPRIRKQGRAIAMRNAMYRMRYECKMSSAQIARRFRIRDTAIVDAEIEVKKADMKRIELLHSVSLERARRAAEKAAAQINEYWRARGIDAGARVVGSTRASLKIRSNITFGKKENAPCHP